MNPIIDVWDNELLTMIDAMVQWQPLAGGFRFTEGPVWMASENALFFSDIPADTIFRWEAEEGTIRQFRRSSRKTNGMTRDPKNYLLACEQVTRRVVQLDRTGRTSVMADRYHGRRLNSPNDVVVHEDGAIWFTDPDYGLQSVDDGYPGDPELSVRGVYRIDPVTGCIALMVDDFVEPNGLAFSYDGTVLYVSDSDQYHVRRFRVQETHVVDKGILGVMPSPMGLGPPDGLTVDPKGYIWVAGPGGLWVWAPDGRALGRVRNPEVVANCEWVPGRPPMVYITATSSICRISVTSRTTEDQENGCLLEGAKK